MSMESHEPSPQLTNQLRAMRIIIVALCLGVLGFMGIAVYLRWSGQAQPLPATPVISYVGAAFAAGILPTALFLPRLLERTWRRQLAGDAGRAAAEAPPATHDQRWWMLYQTRMIISAALLEAPAFFLLVAYLIEGQVWTVLMALAFVTGIAWKYPSQESVERWVREQDELSRREGAGFTP